MPKSQLLVELERAVDQYDQVWDENKRLKRRVGVKGKLPKPMSRRGRVDAMGQKHAMGVGAGSGVAAGLQEVFYLTGWHQSFVLDNPLVWEHALVKAGVISVMGYIAGIMWKAAHHYD